MLLAWFVWGGVRCVLGRFSGMLNQFESMGSSVLYDFGESPMTKGMVTNQGSAVPMEMAKQQRTINGSIWRWLESFENQGFF